ncbi:rRNA maturation RNase YbeY [Aquisalinus flavus]|uniref:Endoribonuclease YbeY n=1 Tax=Aquisalinus flavus TaxID=1526572 RepID=A0A8J2V6N6_9PROT|nr:rRNA maturation RNase YbeY [Aquisalinus flavus]MBD0425450.1 rRNA maturation RNase YbeY [Aquisalinus flavus]UNE48911.1 rRNA maturation RNase YbeY [Aquisalinus flavus]GGD15959.1 endoribonuclease YbeY [Aquisalinus flavus]
MPDVTPPPEPDHHLVHDVIIEHEAWGDIEPVVASCFKAVMAHDPETFCKGTVALLFTSDEAVQRLNREFLGKDKPTNVLSFPTDEDVMDHDGPIHIGDIALAYETCYREAVDKRVALKDHAAHLIFHGVLHLFGYDHEDDDEALVMEKMETDLLADMGIDDPYAD